VFRMRRGFAAAPAPIARAATRVFLQGRRAPQSAHRESRARRPRRSISMFEMSFCEFAEEVAALAHHLTGESHVFFKFGVVGRDPDPVWRLGQEDRIPFFDL